MYYKVLDVHQLSKNYEDLGWVVLCDGDTQKANTAAQEEE